MPLCPRAVNVIKLVYSRRGRADGMRLPPEALPSGTYTVSKSTLVSAYTDHNSVGTGFRVMTENR